MINTKQLFFGGVPTEPDIKKLRETYPADGLTVGRLIPYEEIGGIIKTEYPTHRFKTVTTQWRKHVEKETNIIIGTDPGVGFKVLSEPEKVDLSGAKLRSAAKLARRSYMVASRVEIKRLNEDEKKRLDHQTAVSSRIIASAQQRGAVSHMPSV